MFDYILLYPIIWVHKWKDINQAIRFLQCILWTFWPYREMKTNPQKQGNISELCDPFRGCPPGIPTKSLSWTEKEGWFWIFIGQIESGSIGWTGKVFPPPFNFHKICWVRIIVALYVTMSVCQSVGRSVHNEFQSLTVYMHSIQCIDYNAYNTMHIIQCI